MPKFLSNLPTGQRRAAIAIAIGAVLAVVTLARKSSTGGGLGTDTTQTTGTTNPGPSTFADNGAAEGELNTTLTGIAGNLQSVTDALSAFNPTAAETGSPSVPTDTAATPQIAINLNLPAAAGAPAMASPTRTGSNPVPARTTTHAKATAQLVQTPIRGKNASTIAGLLKNPKPQHAAPAKATAKPAPKAPTPKPAKQPTRKK